MFWATGASDFSNHAERVCRAHARWIERALRRPHAAQAVRIPVRKVAEGGFTVLMSAPGGQERADQWWIDAFARLDATRL